MRYYFIDANNLTLKIPRLAGIFKRDKQGSREQLCHFIAPYFRGKNIKVHLFFDGFENAAFRFPGLHFHYSNARPADEILKNEISKSKNRSLITVVSSDHEIINFGRACACDVVTSEDFARMVEGGAKENEETKRIENLRKDDDEFLRLFTQGDD